MCAWPRRSKNLTVQKTVQSKNREFSIWSIQQGFMYFIRSSLSPPDKDSHNTSLRNFQGSIFVCSILIVHATQFLSFIYPGGNNHGT